MISGDAPNGATGATGSYDGGTAGGSANALTATVSGLGSSPSTGNVVILKTSAANTGAATLAINSGSAIAIKNQDGTTALAGGEMASAKYYLLEYNGTNWVLLNPSDLPTKPYALASKSSQTILNLSNDALTYAAASVNTTGLTYSSGVWTATVAGWYTIELNMVGNNGTFTVIHVYKNGSANPLSISNSMQANSAPRLVTRVKLAVGDTFTPKGEVAGSDVTFSAGSGETGYILITYEGP